VEGRLDLVKLLAMSWTNVLTTHEFWAGRALRRSDQCGDFPIITARSVRASDRRKPMQEDAMQTRKETREDELHDGGASTVRRRSSLRWPPKS